MFMVTKRDTNYNASSECYVDNEVETKHLFASNEEAIAFITSWAIGNTEYTRDEEGVEFLESKDFWFDYFIPEKKNTLFVIHSSSKVITDFASFAMFCIFDEKTNKEYAIIEEKDYKVGDNLFKITATAPRQTVLTQKDMNFLTWIGLSKLQIIDDRMHFFFEVNEGHLHENMENLCLM